MTGKRLCCGVAVLLLMVLGGCGAEPEAKPRATEPSTPQGTASVKPRATASPTPTASGPLGKPAGPYRTGDCIAFVDNAYQQVGCSTRHQAEVTGSGRPPAGAEPPEDFPPRDRRVSPICEQAMRTYLGSADADATRLESRVIWPGWDKWRAGERWFACAVLERDPQDNAAAWTGSRAGALRNGLGALQRCYAGEPLDEPARVVPCSQPHRSEAVPGVVSLGSHTDPVPSYETMMKRSLDPCVRNVRAYLGGSRPGVAERSVMPYREFWAFGVTDAVC